VDERVGTSEDDLTATEAVEQVSFLLQHNVFKAGVSVHERMLASLTELKIYSFFTLL